MTFELKPYGKTDRLSDVNITVTEKIDGTNACVVIQGGEFMGCQSRNRIITPSDDNMGFANWAYENKDDLLNLGDGYHYGEWAGPGIQKNPHKYDKKQFMLFNTYRPVETLPSCVYQVPILYQGVFFGMHQIDEIMHELLLKSKIEEYTPEGVIVYWHSMRKAMKYTFNNNKSKWELPH